MIANLDTSRFAHLQDVMATLPMTRSFIPFCLVFSTPESARDEAIIATLKEALNKLADAFPFLAGRVVLEDCIPKIAVLRDDDNTKSLIELVVQDRRQEVPALEELRKAKFPFSLLDGRFLTPPIVTSWKPREQLAPVITVQASFVKGGLVLGIYGNHTQVSLIFTPKSSDVLTNTESRWTVSGWDKSRECLQRSCPVKH